MHADRHFNAHVCAASSIRAMPEDEKPPAPRVDIYYAIIDMEVEIWLANTLYEAKKKS